MKKTVDLGDIFQYSVTEYGSRCTVIFGFKTVLEGPLYPSIECAVVLGFPTTKSKRWASGAIRKQPPMTLAAWNVDGSNWLM